MNLRERNRRRTRNELASTALRLFLRDGFDETTVEQIAEEVGVSSRTFFRYFPTKEEAFFANQEERLARFKVMLEQPLDGQPPMARVRAVCMAMAGEFMEDRQTALAQYAVTTASRNLMAYDLQLDLQWEEAIGGVLGTTSDDPGLQARARVQAGAIIGVVRAELRHWFRGGGRYDLVARGQEAFELLMRPNLGS